jgi:TetR/AcrR family transcriptional regulator, transcriptional repressor for nem operon
MRARSVNGAATRLRIIRIASELFHKQGIRATSPDRIIEASATGKGQFYHYFKSKEGLVHEVLKSHLEILRASTGFVNPDIATWEDVEKFYRSFMDLQKKFNMRRGCPIGTIASEVTEHDELIRHDVLLIFELIKNKLAAFFIKEKASGRLSPEADEEGMAEFGIAALQGALLLGKIKRDSSTVESILNEALTHLKHYVVIPAEL